MGSHYRASGEIWVRELGEEMKVLYALIVLGCLMVLVGLTGGCEPDTFVIEDVTQEIVDTIYIYDIGQGRAGVCAVCRSDTLDTILEVASFDACAAEAERAAGTVCAYSQFWRE
jgi:hypothetical protein